MKTRAIAITYTPYLKRFSAACVAGIVLSLLLYGTFLLEAVAHTAARAQAEAQTQTLSAGLVDLEEQYLALSRTMTPQRAAELGFVAADEVTTVVEGGGALTLQ